MNGYQQRRFVLLKAILTKVDCGVKRRRQTRDRFIPTKACTAKKPSGSRALHSPPTNGYPCLSCNRFGASAGPTTCWSVFHGTSQITTWLETKMTAPIPERPLLIATGQHAPLVRAGYTLFCALAIVFMAQLEFFELPFVMRFGVVVLACVAMATAIMFAFTAIRCPECKLPWVRWAVATRPRGQWLFRLMQFTTCPKCNYRVPPGDEGAQHADPAIGADRKA
jgi:hypothetical protein